MKFKTQKQNTKAHLLQAAQANAQIKACKRVCFSPTQEEIQLFLSHPSVF
jgi:hypothetical protein